MNWDADFADLPPVTLPDGRKLATLSDLRGYILALPKREQAEPRWQDVAGELLKRLVYLVAYRLSATILRITTKKGTLYTRPFTSQLTTKPADVDQPRTPQKTNAAALPGSCQFKK
jgi:hypothetical protein